MNEQTTIRVLLVDDEEDFLAPTSKALQKRGFGVETATNGRDALAMLENYGCDVIVLDMKMPEMDGLETLKIVKSYWPTIEIIMLTGHGSIESAFQTSKQGAFEFLTKPCDIEELAEKIGIAYRSKQDELKQAEEKGISKGVEGIRLLLVDDEEEFLESTARLFIKRGMHVATANNGLAAIAKLEKETFDVVILDMKMPDMDGIEILKIIKIRWSKTMVILLTGHATLQTANIGLRQGAFAYLTKPHDVNELMGMIIAATQKKRELEKGEIADMIDDFIRRIPGKPNI